MSEERKEPRVFPVYDQDGALSGMLDVDTMQDQVHSITREAIAGLYDESRDAMADRITRQAKKLLDTGSDHLVATAQLAAVLDLTEHLQELCMVAEAVGVPARAKLQEAYEVAEESER